MIEVLQNLLYLQTFNTTQPRISKMISLEIKIIFFISSALLNSLSDSSGSQGGAKKYSVSHAD
jgi:hypothetical protein